MIYPHKQIREKVLALYEAGGYPKGSSTGWPSLDNFYTVGLGQWTLVTGTPNSGKSEWLDALMINLALSENWKFLIYSVENWPLELHHAKLIEKYIGKPFSPGKSERISEAELNAAEDWIAGQFYFCTPDAPDICAILDEAGQYLKSIGTNWKTGVVIDPWNQLEHHRPSNMTETDYVGHTLSLVMNRVREYDMHLWLVAHPSKLQRGRDGTFPIPTPRDVSGSSNFWNKSDNAITVWRDLTQETTEVQIHVQKVRWKHIGRIGATYLDYEISTGRYKDSLKNTNY